MYQDEGGSLGAKLCRAGCQQYAVSPPAAGFVGIPTFSAEAAPAGEQAQESVSPGLLSVPTAV